MYETSYWDRYYGRVGVEGGAELPSQFGAFVAGEFSSERPTIVEFGCGSGRDTLFFARYGFRAIGIDASAAGIEICKGKSEGAAHFLCSDISSSSLLDELRPLIESDKVLVYARFFVHAIDETAELAFLALARQLCGRSGAVAVEFRTSRDEALAKITPAHYRRFVNPMDFLVRAQSKGFEAAYFVEGFGYAKFKQDDAHVARFLPQPSARTANENAAA